MLINGSEMHTMRPSGTDQGDNKSQLARAHRSPTADFTYTSIPSQITKQHRITLIADVGQTYKRTIRRGLDIGNRLADLHPPGQQGHVSITYKKTSIIDQ